jgi:hypothetical protein
VINSGETISRCYQVVARQRFYERFWARTNIHHDEGEKIY